ncbi:MAG: hypothetical protein AAB557_00785 [Patescibacteria group bacterium]
MTKLVMAYILGIVSFLMAFGGIFSFLFSVPGLLLAIHSLKIKEKRILIPLGYQGTVGRKKLTAQPYVTTRYLAYIALVLNIFSMAVSLFTTFSLLAFFTVAMR